MEIPVEKILSDIDLEGNDSGDLRVISPIDGSEIAAIQTSNSIDALKNLLGDSEEQFNVWRKVPAPIRGDLLRHLGNVLRENKEKLAKLVTLECGKIYQESLGEVQEMIDICDFAVGLSRQLYGLTIASERPGHKLQENWHPLGPVIIISAFNFPVAVWAWNYALATVCGNTVIWKPSEKTPMTALATTKLLREAVLKFNKEHPEYEYTIGMHQLIIPVDNALSQLLVEDPQVKLVSATGSTKMGKKLAPIIAKRLGKSLFELGGNNAMIVMPSANLEMALKAIVFSAVGTSGQRCTTLRRLFVHKDVYKEIVSKLKKIYKTIPIGNPFDERNLMGPLIDKAAASSMRSALSESKMEGGKITGGKRILKDKVPEAYYVEPAIVEFDKQHNTMKEETFAPILYIMQINSLEEGIALNNDVKQGLSSSLFSTDVRETELFLTEVDTGIANINIGPSGAEIGGAFGGEKDTGGGRESGTDSWKNYMWRSTNTINYSDTIPLAQGIKFDV